MEILNYDEQPAGSYAIAIFDLDMRPKTKMILRRLKLVKSKKGHLFVNFPSFKDGEENGKPIWKEYIGFPDELEKRLFNEAVTDLAKNFLNAPVPF